MIKVRKNNERGVSEISWLKSFHTFSFNQYHDPAHVNFRHLRVLNDDYIAPKGGFGTHPHNDMEIITFIHTGSLEHKDSLGNGSVIRKGEIQRMTAGNGIMHSEFNPSDTEEVHLYQIWIFPNQKGLEPSYNQVVFDYAKAENALLLLASNEKTDETVKINQDVSLYLSVLKPHIKLEYIIEERRHIWVQVISGELEMNGLSVATGDGVALSNESQLTIKSQSDSEILLFDLC